MGSHLHHSAEHAMQTARSDLEILPGKHLLQIAVSHAHIGKRPSLHRHLHGHATAKSHLVSADKLAEENWYLCCLWCGSAVSTGFVLLPCSHHWPEAYLCRFPSRACVAAVVRLKTTVDFANTEDQMYYIGPLLFWACAEMTCGFFILCVPCIPKLISDSDCSRRVKRALGVSTGKPSAGGHSSSQANSKFAASYALRKKRRSSDILDTTIDASAYSRIDEEAMRLDELEGSESTKHLRKSHHSGGGVHVTKTVLVTRSHTRSNIDDEFSLANKLGMPWAKSTKSYPPKSEEHP